MALRERVDSLILRVERGEFLEAIEEFYAEDAEVRENVSAPRSGIAAILEHERNVLKVMTFLKSRALSSVVEGDRVAIHWLFEIKAATGALLTMNEVAYQRWRDGKIVSEQYFYDPQSMGGEAD